MYHGAADVEAGLMRHLMRRQQQIGQVELVGAVAPYLSLPHILAGRRVIHWIDNTSALAALAKGYSGVPDSAHLVHVFHAWAAAAGTAVWFEYVPSAANPADEPSRSLALAETTWQPAPPAVEKAAFRRRERSAEEQPLLQPAFAAAAAAAADMTTIAIYTLDAHASPPQAPRFAGLLLFLTCGRKEESVRLPAAAVED